MKHYSASLKRNERFVEVRGENFLESNHENNLNKNVRMLFNIEGGWNNMEPGPATPRTISILYFIPQRYSWLFPFAIFQVGNSLGAGRRSPYLNIPPLLVGSEGKYVNKHDRLQIAASDRPITGRRQSTCFLYPARLPTRGPYAISLAPRKIFNLNETILQPIRAKNIATRKRLFLEPLRENNPITDCEWALDIHI